MAVGGDGLGREEVELDDLDAAAAQRLLELTPRAALRHHDRRRRAHVPQVRVLRMNNPMLQPISVVAAGSSTCVLLGNPQLTKQLCLSL